MHAVEDRDKMIIQLYMTGITQKEISERVGCARKTVRKVVRDNGFDTTRKRKVKCKSCGLEHETVKTHTKFCSDKCRVVYNKKNGGSLTKQCAWCNKEIKTYKKNRVFCNNDCYRLYVDSQPRKEPEPYVHVLKTERKCKQCGSTFKATSGVSRTLCSYECRSANSSALSVRKRREENILNDRECINCGVVFNSQYNVRACSQECSNKYMNRLKEYKRRKRLLGNGRIDKDITLDKLIKRDKNVCYLCGLECNKKDFHLDGSGYFITGKGYPSVEHIKPVSKGGEHTWDNVKLAHHYCNLLKSNKID